MIDEDNEAPSVKTTRIRQNVDKFKEEGRQVKEVFPNFYTVFAKLLFSNSKMRTEVDALKLRLRAYQEWHGALPEKVEALFNSSDGDLTVETLIKALNESGHE